MAEGEPKPQDKLEEPERTSGLIKVVGVSPEMEEKVLESVKEARFDRQEIYPHECEKKPEQVQMINGILSHLPEFIKKYGGQPVPIEPKHIHVFDSNKLTEEEKRALRGTVRGVYKHEAQAVAITTGFPIENNLTFASLVAHELIHFESYQSVTADDSDNTTVKLSKRREGVMVKERGGGDDDLYFHGLNEAITVELEKRFGDKYFKSIPALGKDVKVRDELRKAWLKQNSKMSEEEANRTIANAIITREVPDRRGGIRRESTLIAYDRSKERELLWQIINEIQEKNPGKFASKEEVFKVFAEAYFTGNLLKVARLIEKTYGEGSFLKTKKKSGKGSFRKLGEETKLKKIPKPENK